MGILARIRAALLYLCIATPVVAQEAPLSFATVERPPFSTQANGLPSGFSLELSKAIAAELGRDVSFKFYDSFPAMLSAVEVGLHDGAVANISITADREKRFDFSQPIFESGIGILLLEDSQGSPILTALLRRDFILSILLALALLFCSGMLMWSFERRKQPYFDRPLKQALFPSFWWALNLVVNGGFEERQPQSPLGRFFAVILVVSSLFVVSIFVATITSALTVAALQDTVESVNDLEGKRVATVQNSTSATFLDVRDLSYRAYGSPDEIFSQLERGRVDAVVFDAPILAYYEATASGPATRLLPRIYRRENYGIVLTANSPLSEQIDQTLLQLRESGIYDDLMQRWFGGAPD